MKEALTFLLWAVAITFGVVFAVLVTAPIWALLLAIVLGITKA